MSSIPQSAFQIKWRWLGRGFSVVLNKWFHGFYKHICMCASTRTPPVFMSPVLWGSHVWHRAAAPVDLHCAVPCRTRQQDQAGGRTAFLRKFREREFPGQGTPLIPGGSAEMSFPLWNLFGQFPVRMNHTFPCSQSIVFIPRAFTDCPHAPRPHPESTLKTEWSLIHPNVLSTQNHAWSRGGSQ